MASTDDINSTLKGVVTGMAQMVLSFASPGRTAQTTSSPVPTLFTVGTTVLQVIPFSSQRRAISFHNSNPLGTTIWLLPVAANTTPALNVGVPIVPGGDYVIDPLLGANCAWNGVAATTVTLTILEFV